MGIQALYQFIHAAKQDVPLTQFTGQTIAIDISILLHQFLSQSHFSLVSTTSFDNNVAHPVMLQCIARTFPTQINFEKRLSWVINSIVQVLLLLYGSGITPLCVFDSTFTLNLPKHDVQQARRRNQITTVEQLQMLWEQGHILSCHRKYSASLSITTQLVVLLIMALLKLHIPYLMAPVEADLTCLYLCLHHNCSCVMTKDSDLLLHGCTIMSPLEIRQLPYCTIVQGRFLPQFVCWKLASSFAPNDMNTILSTYLTTIGITSTTNTTSTTDDMNSTYHQTEATGIGNKSATIDMHQTNQQLIPHHNNVFDSIVQPNFNDTLPVTSEIESSSFDEESTVILPQPIKSSHKRPRHAISSFQHESIQFESTNAPSPAFSFESFLKRYNTFLMSNSMTKASIPSSSSHSISSLSSSVPSSLFGEQCCSLHQFEYLRVAELFVNAVYDSSILNSIQHNQHLYVTQPIEQLYSNDETQSQNASDFQVISIPSSLLKQSTTIQQFTQSSYQSLMKHLDSMCHFLVSLCFRLKIDSSQMAPLLPNIPIKVFPPKSVNSLNIGNNFPNGVPKIPIFFSPNFTTLSTPLSIHPATFVLGLVSVLCGCDYSAGLAGVGPQKAFQIVSHCLQDDQLFAHSQPSSGQPSGVHIFSFLHNISLFRQFERFVFSNFHAMMLLIRLILALSLTLLKTCDNQSDDCHLSNGMTFPKPLFLFPFLSSSMRNSPSDPISCTDPPLLQQQQEHQQHVTQFSMYPDPFVFSACLSLILEHISQHEPKAFWSGVVTSKTTTPCLTAGIAPQVSESSISSLFSSDNHIDHASTLSMNHLLPMLRALCMWNFGPAAFFPAPCQPLQQHQHATPPSSQPPLLSPISPVQRCIEFLPPIPPFLLSFCSSSLASPRDLVSQSSSTSTLPLSLHHEFIFPDENNPPSVFQWDLFRSNYPDDIHRLESHLNASISNQLSALFPRFSLRDVPTKNNMTTQQVKVEDLQTRTQTEPQTNIQTEPQTKTPGSQEEAILAHNNFRQLSPPNNLKDSPERSHLINILHYSSHLASYSDINNSLPSSAAPAPCLGRPFEGHDVHCNNHIESPAVDHSVSISYIIFDPCSHDVQLVDSALENHHSTFLFVAHQPIPDDGEVMLKFTSFIQQQQKQQQQQQQQQHPAPTNEYCYNHIHFPIQHGPSTSSQQSTQVSSPPQQLSCVLVSPDVCPLVAVLFPSLKTCQDTLPRNHLASNNNRTASQLDSQLSIPPYDSINTTNQRSNGYIYIYTNTPSTIQTLLCAISWLFSINSVFAGILQAANPYEYLAKLLQKESISFGSYILHSPSSCDIDIGHFNLDSILANVSPLQKTSSSEHFRTQESQLVSQYDNLSPLFPQSFHQSRQSTENLFHMAASSSSLSCPSPFPSPSSTLTFPSWLPHFSKPHKSSIERLFSTSNQPHHMFDFILRFLYPSNPLSHNNTPVSCESSQNHNSNINTQDISAPSPLPHFGPLTAFLTLGFDSSPSTEGPKFLSVHLSDANANIIKRYIKTNTSISHLLEQTVTCENKSMSEKPLSSTHRLTLSDAIHASAAIRPTPYSPIFALGASLSHFLAQLSAGIIFPVPTMWHFHSIWKNNSFATFSSSFLPLAWNSSVFGSGFSPLPYLAAAVHSLSPSTFIVPNYVAPKFLADKTNLKIDAQTDPTTKSDAIRPSNPDQLAVQPQFVQNESQLFSPKSSDVPQSIRRKSLYVRHNPPQRQ